MGVALTGDIGSSERREFTVLGDVVNTASRIEDEVAGPGEIVMSDATYEKVKHKYKGRSLGTRTCRPVLADQAVGRSGRDAWA